jgi:hypothetical protein
VRELDFGGDANARASDAGSCPSGRVLLFESDAGVAGKVPQAPIFY